MDDNMANNLAERALSVRKKDWRCLKNITKKMKTTTSASIAARFFSGSR